MKYTKKPKKKKLPIVLIITLILILIMYYSLTSKTFNSIKIKFHDIGSRIQEFFLVKSNPINDDISLGINKELEDENNELKRILELKESSYEMVTALVLKRDINWYQTITINKGTKDNIDINMAVISSDGLIGKIKEVGDNYSVVELITSNLSTSKVAVDVLGDNNYHGILVEYDKDNNLIIIDNISKSSNINIGDKVYTNGLGGIFPSGIYIGEVVSITTDSLNLNKVLKVKPITNYDNIRYVNIIRR